VVFDPMQGGVGEHNIEPLDVVQLTDVHQEKPQVLRTLDRAASIMPREASMPTTSPLGTRPAICAESAPSPAPKIENPLGSLQIEFCNELRPPFLLVGGCLLIFLASNSCVISEYRSDVVVSRPLLPPHSMDDPTNDRAFGADDAAHLGVKFGRPRFPTIPGRALRREYANRASGNRYARRSRLVMLRGFGGVRLGFVLCTVPGGWFGAE